ncbi:MAG: lipopolysaccharide assembly protein LapA domain-containing protein [Proteobacteria bacterium]|nr:lipopolysaccharide assembly protein LapA domain-containing protein [Pseudomonadota bacterium]
MSKILFWIVVAPMAAAIIVFSVNNRVGVTLDFWPFDLMSRPVPLYAVALASIVFGFFAGGFVAWGSAAKVRKRARREAERAKRAERELADAKDQIHRLQSEAEGQRDKISLQPHNISSKEPPKLPLV